MKTAEFSFKNRDSQASDYCNQNGEISVAIGLRNIGKCLVKANSPQFSAGTPAVSLSSLPNVVEAKSIAPNLHFWLEKAGSLRWSQTYAVPAETVAAADSSTPAAVHPLTGANASTAEKSHSIIMKSLELHVESQIESQGFFHCPFKVKAAMRMTDGSLINISDTSEMLPSILPPKLAISSVTASDNADTKLIRFSDNSYPYFRLRCKALTAIPADWLSYVQAIEIYSTAPIRTYRDTFPAHSACRYASLIGIMGSRAETDILSGIWANASEEETKKYLTDADLATLVWPISSNPSLQGHLANDNDFRLIASISPAEITANATIDIAPLDSSPEVIAKLTALTADDAATVTAEAHAMLYHGGMLHFAEGNALWHSLPLRPFSLSDPITVGGGSILALVASPKTLSQLQLVKYPIYAFATDGLWAIPANEKSYGQPALVSPLRFDSAPAIADTPHGACFLHNGNLYLINDTQATRLPIDIPQSNFANLPHADALLNAVSQIATASDAALHYDYVNDTLFVTRTQSHMSIAYPFKSGIAHIATSNGEFSLLSRPLRPSDARKRARISSAKLIGTGLENVTYALYASDDLHSWRKIASTTSAEITCLCGTPYRYYAISVTGSATDTLALHGISFNLH